MPGLEPIKNIKRYISSTLTYYTLPDGLHHREDGPSVIHEYDDGRYSEEWWFKGDYHRFGGPALTYSEGKHLYFVRGENHSRLVWLWLSERNYEWETMSDLEKWELDLFMRSL